MPVGYEAQDGWIFTPRKARKGYLCKACHEDILWQDIYYAVTIGGGGLGSLKFPTRIHLHCKDAFLEMMRKPKRILLEGE